jgi:hypothetical protein
MVFLVLSFLSAFRLISYMHSSFLKMEGVYYSETCNNFETTRRHVSEYTRSAVHSYRSESPEFVWLKFVFREETSCTEEQCFVHQLVGKSQGERLSSIVRPSEPRQRGLLLRLSIETHHKTSGAWILRSEVSRAVKMHICGPLGLYHWLSGRSLPMFRSIILPPASGYKLYNF